MSSATGPGGAGIERVAIDDASLGAFYRSMNPTERHTFWACAAGWALDGMDFMIYPLVIGTIITLWQVEASTAGLAATVTLLASALVGYLSAGVGLAGAIALFAAIAYGVFFVAAFALPETRGRVLHADS